MKNNSKLCSILATICIACAIVCVAVLTTNLDDRFKHLVYVIEFLFGGCLGSFFIAKYVINKDVETKMSELSDTVRRDEKEKQTFLKNLNWIIKNFLVAETSSNKFKTDEEYNAYKQGYNDGVEDLQANYLNRLQFGVIETNTMFTEDWAEKN